jgi:hypothetical protein
MDERARQFAMAGAKAGAIGLGEQGAKAVEMPTIGVGAILGSSNAFACALTPLTDPDSLEANNQGTP